MCSLLVNVVYVMQVKEHSELTVVLYTAEFTLERNHTNVTFVTKNLVCLIF